MFVNITDYKLYKAVSVCNHKWIEGYYNPQISYAKDYMWVKHEGFFEKDAKIIPETLCEFTGFSDTYGNKIFDNDKITVFITDCNFPLNDSIVFKNKENNEWYYKYTSIFLGKKKTVVQPLNSAKYLRVTGNKFN